MTGGVSVCDYTQLSYELPIVARGVNYARSRVPTAWIPKLFIPASSPYNSRFIHFRYGVGYIGGVSFLDPWTVSPEAAAVGVVESYFPLMMSCQNKTSARTLQTLQIDTQLAGTLISNHLTQSNVGSPPANVPYPGSLTWAPWKAQERFISSTLVQIRGCRPVYLN
jgi:hypothetical protein